MGNSDIQAKRTELVLRDSAGTVSAKPELIYFNLLITTSNPVAMPTNTISVPKASDWSHAVLFIRPIGTSDGAEFQLVRQVVVCSILEQQEAIDQFFEIPSVTPKLNQFFFSRANTKQRYLCLLRIRKNRSPHRFLSLFSLTHSNIEIANRRLQIRSRHLAKSAIQPSKTHGDLVGND